MKRVKVRALTIAANPDGTFPAFDILDDATIIAVEYIGRLMVVQYVTTELRVQAAATR